jgi:16S rRNA (guanine527-N7)-methyltransferase
VSAARAQSLSAQLHCGLQALGQDPEKHPCEAYLAWLDLLCRWNRAYNLTGDRRPERILSRHLLDSLSLLPYLRGSRGLDIGSGAGLPGFLLALARPDMQWVLLDSNRKKIRFLRQAILELKPANVEAVAARIEEYVPPQPFATIVSRAWQSVPAFCTAAAPLLDAGGVLLAMQGEDAESALDAAIRQQYRVRIHPVRIPGVESGRSIIELEPASGAVTGAPDSVR